MKKESKIIDEKRGIVQITTDDGRFYSLLTTDEETGIPVVRFYPSITTITSYWPKGEGFKRHLLNHTAEEAESILATAGNRGSRIHAAIEAFIKGDTIKHDAQFPDSDGNMAELSADEYRALVKFAEWDAVTMPEYIVTEKTVISKAHGYAGTLDCLARINGKTYLTDWKTGKSVYTSHFLQVAALKRAAIEEGLIKADEACGTAILQVGMGTNIGWKWTEVPETTKSGKSYFDLFLQTKTVWEEETAELSPRQIDLPLSVKMNREVKKASQPAGRTVKKESVNK